MGWHDSYSNPELRQPMKLALNMTGLVILTLISAIHAASEEIGAWSLSESASANGAAIHSASLVSANLIASGYQSGDYTAIYSIACESRDAAGWKQLLKFEDALSSRGQIELLATVDSKIPREEFWIVGKDKHLLTRENVPDIAELRTARTMTLSWNWGWSWLWLSDQASFELGDVEAVIFTLAKRCGIEEP